MDNLIIKPLGKSDKQWVEKVLKKRWGSVDIVSRGKINHASLLPGLKAELHGQAVGLLTYNIVNKNCEIVTLDSLCENSGVGKSLIAKIILIAQAQKCHRVWLVTTNDNLHAQNFYKNRGFTIKIIHRNAMDISRTLKPEIPLIGMNNIPLKDEIEMEIVFNKTPCSSII